MCTKTRKSPRKIPKGFTLIELIITLIIIGVVAAFAIPSMSNMLQSQAMTATANEIVSTLQSARSEAIKRSTNVRVCFKQLSGGNQCRNVTDNNIDFMYVFIDLDNDEVFDRNDETELYLSNEINSKISFKHPDDDNLKMTKSILFNSKGGVIIDNDQTQNRGEIGLCDDRNSDNSGRIIQITNTGRAQVSRITSASSVSCT